MKATTPKAAVAAIFTRPNDRARAAGLAMIWASCLCAPLHGQWNPGAAGSISYGGGNVGIGTATPVTKLHVAGGAGTALSVDATSGGGHHWLIGDGAAAPSGTFVIYDYSQPGHTGHRLAIDSTGNVGIGTAAPAVGLDVVSTFVANRGNVQILDNTAQAANTGGQLTLGGKFNSAGSLTPGVMVAAKKHNAADGDYSFDMAFLAYKNLDAHMTERMRIDGSNGNVGIGTAAPAVNLDVIGAFVANRGNVEILDNTAQAADTGGQLTLGGKFRNAGQLTPGVMIAAKKHNATDGDYSFDMAFLAYKNLDAHMTERMRIDGSNGNVGIGTTPATSPYKLSVNGTIGAKEIIVTNTGWADYVFQPGYRLTPMTELAAYIEEHHHLPGIPSESEVREKGVSVGEMQARLLAKIEELTLHMIQAEERNRALKERVERIEGRAKVQPNPDRTLP